MHRWGNTKPLTLVGGLGPSIGICLTLLPCRSLERICIQESINANIHLNQEETSNREQENWFIDFFLIHQCFPWSSFMDLLIPQIPIVHVYVSGEGNPIVRTCRYITTRSKKNFAQSLVHNCSKKFTPMTQEHQCCKTMMCNNLSELVKPSPSLN